jgi:D-alanyl-lipoteichoic acid acyltransferase DltB (MBOAT superfamily)
MLFNSAEYLIFFLPLVALIAYWLPARLWGGFLLIASYTFYMSWEPRFGALILGVTAISYATGRLLSNHRHAKVILILGLAGNLGTLFIFKYLGFAARSADALMLLVSGPRVPVPDLILPIGISFYVLQSSGYLFDVYREKTAAERRFVTFALYVSFFPQLVAGPIERAGNLLPQLRERVRPKIAEIKLGLWLIIWGLFKKIVIADAVAPLVNTVYANPENFSGLECLAATYLFAFQVFCDFSGYSHIAIGSAKLLGVNLMENFRQPFFAKDVIDLWRRWHISLSTWFRDYVYVPLGGNRNRYLRNVMAVFVLSGFWHGANNTFVVWGAFHGIWMLAHSWVHKLRGGSTFKGRFTILRIALTFNLFVISLVFFRAENMSDAMTIMNQIFIECSLGFDIEHLGVRSFGLSATLFFIAVMECVHVFEYRTPDFIRDCHPAVRWGLAIFFLNSIFYFGHFTSEPFLYFRF